MPKSKEDIAPVKQFYVYLLLDRAVPFYVGKGCMDRINEHEQEARRGHICYKCHKIRKIWRSGRQIKKRIVFRTHNEIEAYRYEAKLIATIGLVNLTNIRPGDDCANAEFYEPPRKPITDYTYAELDIFLRHLPGMTEEEHARRVRRWYRDRYDDCYRIWASYRRRRMFKKAEVWRKKLEAIEIEAGWMDQQELDIQC
jgi:hypothetical protein